MRRDLVTMVVHCSMSMKSEVKPDNFLLGLGRRANQAGEHIISIHF